MNAIFGMDNNLVFAKMLGVFGINKNNQKIAELLQSQGVNATVSKVKGWRSSPDKAQFRAMPDFALEAFFKVIQAYDRDFDRLRADCSPTADNK